MSDFLPAFGSEETEKQLCNDDEYKDTEDGGDHHCGSGSVVIAVEFFDDGNGERKRSWRVKKLGEGQLEEDSGESEEPSPDEAADDDRNEDVDDGVEGVTAVDVDGVEEIFLYLG